MKLKVCTKKGKQAFNRAGFGFTSNPIEIDVPEDVVQILKNEAMLIVEAMEDLKEIEEIENIEEVKEVEEVKEEVENIKMVEKEPKKQIDLSRLKFIPVKKNKK